MRIAILEDDKSNRRHLSRLIRNYFADQTLSYFLDAFVCEEEFTQYYKPEKYDLFFLGNYNGTAPAIELARRFHADNPQAAIVFVTNSAEFAVECFEINALHYIIKPITAAHVAEIFKRFHNIQTENQTVQVMVNRILVQLPVSSIFYIKAETKYCTIYCKHQNLKTYIPLERLLEQLPENRFTRTHRSYAVNLAYIDSMKQGAFNLKNGAAVPISRRMWTEAKQKYMKYSLNQ